MRAGTRRRIDKAEHHLALAIQSAFIDYIAVRIRDELPLADLLEPEAFGPCLALASFGITAIGISPPKISADRMVGRRLELRVDRDHSKSRLPAEVPPLPGNAFPNQEKGDRMFPRLGLCDRNRADSETVSFRKFAEVSLMFLDKQVIPTPD